MVRTPFVHPLTIVVALAAAAGAADMSKTQLADLKKVSRKIDQVQRTVESLLECHEVEEIAIREQPLSVGIEERQRLDRLG